MNHWLPAEDSDNGFMDSESTGFGTLCLQRLRVDSGSDIPHTPGPAGEQATRIGLDPPHSAADVSRSVVLFCSTSFPPC